MGDVPRNALLANALAGYPAGRALRYGYDETTAPEGMRGVYETLAPKPGTQYGDLLPVARDADGSIRPAMPNMMREGLLGIADLLSGTETGEVTGRGANSITMGGLGTGMALAPRGAMAVGGAPIKAYHGSPYDFDKFNFSKIGAGEGQQVFGHGLYFAEREGVARSYRDMPHPAKGNDPRDDVNTLRQNWQTNVNPRQLGPEEVASLMRDFPSLAGLTGDKNIVTNITRYVNGHEPGGAVSSEAMYALRALDKQLPQPNPGKMYEVAIHADPERFLDWDKPLSGQSPKVVEAVQSVASNLPQLTTGPNIVRRNREAILSGDPTVPGDVLYNNLGGFKEPGRTSDALREAGIPGIRYLDAGSRTAGDGSRNYVVFPTQDEIIQILRKYGMSVPAPVAPPLPNGMRPPQEREY